MKVHSINVRSLTNCQVTSHSMNLGSLNSAQVKVHCMHLRYHWVLARSKLHSISSRLLGLTRSNSIPSISRYWSPQSSQYSRQTFLFDLHNSQCENSSPWIRSLWFLYVMNFGVTPTPNPKIYMWFCRVWFFWPCHLVNVNFIVSTSLILACEVEKQLSLDCDVQHVFC